jgi:hypothetical protein
MLPFRFGVYASLNWVTSPSWLYRVTEGIHVMLGLALVPVVLVRGYSRRYLLLVNAELPASTVFRRIDLHSNRPCLVEDSRGRRASDPSAGVRQPENDYSAAVQRCMSCQPTSRKAG